MSPFLIAPSILSANFACLGSEVEQVIEAGADLVHFDVMDNHYVPNLTVGPLVCESLVKYGIKKPIDVHLMVDPVDQMIEDFATAGAHRISFHPEATKHLDRSVQLVVDNGCEVGLVLNPATPLNCLDHIIDKLDFILMMSVNPGFGGQKFIPQTLEKIRAVKQRVQASGKQIRIQIDGGVKVDNIRSIAEAGADTFVAGSAIFNQPDYKQVIDQMRLELSKVNMA
ncbi:ribulose-phosphate 3-epimerase [Aliiglaciecola aliphaticivorans]